MANRLVRARPAATTQMGKLLPEITDKEAKFIASQKVFFVATSPLSAQHHVSVSPKSPGDACVVLDPHTVAYADLIGSGAETAAHVMENGRMTLLFCNTEAGPPKILRLFGTATLILAQDLAPDRRVQSLRPPDFQASSVECWIRWSSCSRAQ